MSAGSIAASSLVEHELEVSLSKRSLFSTCALVMMLMPMAANLAAQAVPPASLYETAVRPLPTEDIAEPCHYTLNLSQTRGSISIVWVIFDRGRDVHDLASDPDVLGFARRFHVALLLQSHCPGKLESDRGDMNMKPEEGLGPALLRALDQFAQQTGHPELVRASFIFLGFSGAGPLSARLVQEFSPRTFAAILTSPGHYEPQGINTVKLDPVAWQVPELIVANGGDDRTGTKRPYEYFARYRRQGAPWTFALQNHSPHCCTANAKVLMLGWLSAVLKERTPVRPGLALRDVDQTHARLGVFESVPAEVTDEFGTKTFNAKDAQVLSGAHRSDRGRVTSWLPNARVATDWMTFVQLQAHPVLPLN
jgi:dienelactone hydrolase